jgi:1,5-anhydro-D-fructose reductase (1,5-anhydro-D-mannitol-forming)
MPVSKHFLGRNEVRWGILGCGDVTEIKSGPGFLKATGSRLTAVMRRNGALAADYARRHGVQKWYDSADALIEDPAVDAVYVATPPGSHADYALRVAAAGKPAYIEKPMARHGGECDRMVDAFAAADLPLFVAYYRRRLPGFMKVKELLDAGAIGRVTGATYRLAEPHHRKPDQWRVDASVAGAGHFLDLASHALDLLDFFFGPLAGVEGGAANAASSYGVEDSVTLQFRIGGGALGSMSCNFASAVRDDTMRLTGTEGEITFPVFRSEPLRWDSAGGSQFFDLPYPPHVGQPLIQSVVDDLLGLGECPSTGVSARRTSRIMDKVLEGYYGGRDDAFWNRPETWPGRRRS